MSSHTVYIYIYIYIYNCAYYKTSNFILSFLGQHDCGERSWLCPPALLCTGKPIPGNSSLNSRQQSIPPSHWAASVPRSSHPAMPSLPMETAALGLSSVPAHLASQLCLPTLLSASTSACTLPVGTGRTGPCFPLFVSLRPSQGACRSPVLGWQCRLKPTGTVSAAAVGESQNSRGCCRLE